MLFEFVYIKEIPYYSINNNARNVCSPFLKIHAKTSACSRNTATIDEFFSSVLLAIHVREHPMAARVHVPRLRAVGTGAWSERGLGPLGSWFEIFMEEPEFHGHRYYTALQLA